ncbi:MAG: ECF transporter S component [Promethearchaeota archaeon]
MKTSTINFKENPTRAIAMTGIFTALYAIFNFIAIPDFASHEHVINLVCAALFGPYVAAIASVAGELVILPFKGVSIFLPSTLIGNILTAFIVGFGRNFARYFKKRSDAMSERKSRMYAEGLSFVIALFARYAFYIFFDAILISAGIPLPNTIMFFALWFLIVTAYKVAWLPVCITIVEQIRKGMNVIYFDKDLDKDLDKDFDKDLDASMNG